MSVNASLHSDSDPLVTIAIPTFNRASWLKDCINSALSQTYKNFEVIVSDNASTDETQEVLKAFHDRRLRAVRQKSNIGLLPNWNACLAEAKGEYIVVVADDDRIAPWLLERSVALVRRDPQVPIVIALSDFYVPAIPRTWRVRAKLETGIWNGTDILQELLNLPLLVGISTYTIRTEALRAMGGFPVNFPYAADMAVWASLLFAGKAGFVNESCGTVSLHNASPTSHDARETSRLAMDLRLSDNQKVIDLIINMADCSIEDPERRRKIRLLAERSFARSVVAHVTEYRREGAKLLEVLPLIWKWRRKLKKVRIGYNFRLATALAVLILPRLIADRFRRFKRTYLGMRSEKYSKHLPDEYVHYHDRGRS